MAFVVFIFLWQICQAICCLMSDCVYATVKKDTDTKGECIYLDVSTWLKDGFIINDSHTRISQVLNLPTSLTDPMPQTTLSTRNQKRLSTVERIQPPAAISKSNCCEGYLATFLHFEKRFLCFTWTGTWLPARKRSMPNNVFLLRWISAEIRTPRRLAKRTR